MIIIFIIIKRNNKVKITDVMTQEIPKLKGREVTLATPPNSFPIYFQYIAHK